MWISWFEIPYNLRGLNSDSSCASHRPRVLIFHWMWCLYATRQMTRFLVSSRDRFSSPLFMELVGVVQGKGGGGFPGSLLLQGYHFWFSAFWEPKGRFPPPHSGILPHEMAPGPPLYWLPYLIFWFWVPSVSSTWEILTCNYIWHFYVF